MEEITNKLTQDLDVCTSELVHRLRFLTAQEDKLTGIQFFALRLLAKEGRMKVTEIASYLGVTLSAVTGLVNRLYKMELVYRDQDEGDRRVVWIRPSEKGFSLLARANERRARKLKSYLGELSLEDLEKFHQIIQQLLLQMERDR
ncbi:MAG: MarR family transcriptional regulator [Clostridia bacterium]|jgi:DNA-binding MarR family transcriptional regulator|nr:MarR family transcriptional regulator [Clostridia bacterium]